MTGAELAAGGDAVARAPDGRVVFVTGAAPSETVRVEVVRDNPRFLRARTVEVLEASPSRASPRCRHFGACGGCTLQHVGHAAQVASKQAALVETLARIGRLDRDRIAFDPPWAGEPYGYRTRVRLARDGGALGFFTEGTREIVDLGECPILARPLEALLETIDRSEAGEVRACTAGGRTSTGDPIRAEHRFGPVIVDPAAFGQANEAGNDAMLDHVDRALAGLGPFDAALELYGGSGNFTRVIGRHAKAVTMVEADPGAAALARSVLPPHVRVDTGDAASARGPADLVVVDPPRAGLPKHVAERIGAIAPRALVYVSCDAATFARDAALLGAGGLTLARIRMFDLYPQTAHLEVIGTFTR